MTERNIIFQMGAPQSVDMTRPSEQMSLKMVRVENFFPTQKLAHYRPTY